MRFCNIPNNIIAITGGIASGKTTYCKELEKKGHKVFYADQIVKKIYEYMPMKELLWTIEEHRIDKRDPQIISRDNVIAFDALRYVAFKDTGILDKLEEAVGTYFEGEFLKQYMDSGKNEPNVECWSCGSGFYPDDSDLSVDYDTIYIEHPLVRENGIEDQFDEVIVIDAPLKTRVKRLMARDQNCCKETAKEIIKRQEDRLRRKENDSI